MNGRVDVVTPGEISLWTHPTLDPVVREGRLFGRGSLDMKGQIAAGLAALKAVSDAGMNLFGSVGFQSVIAEEDGGLGTSRSYSSGGRDRRRHRAWSQQI
uniref:Acetylornithine deacetylase/succinyl-diaminopimelate desuccinylase and related deacylases n=1 Tax=uncultured Gemmatimonadales bacterium HF0130_03D03 TaxID=710742 RepID=E0XSR1_9BACT|nr:acetylornithine deacetylase/succinyl-diaminopimelate desuccinylase and related deacylases [uncultured Gemmatimonadales bacterium HF0130_03D03]